MRIRIKKEQPVFQSKDKLPFEKINTSLASLGWDSTTEYDEDWNYYILAGKTVDDFGYVIRRIKPHRIKSAPDLLSAVKLQQRLRGDLVEIMPFKIHKGDRIFFPELSDYMDFMSEARFPLFRKFFKTSDFSLEGVDKSEARENKDA
jgi:GH43 family beta-xylosidase